MKMPDIEDVKELANYILIGDREKEDFKEQVIIGDLQSENEEDVEKLIESYMTIEEAIESFSDEELEAFAILFGTNHAYPLAIRIITALNQETSQVDLGISKEAAEAAKEAYNRGTGNNVKK
jgi:hypothetical protein